MSEWPLASVIICERRIVQIGSHVLVVEAFLFHIGRKFDGSFVISEGFSGVEYDGNEECEADDVLEG